MPIRKTFILACCLFGSTHTFSWGFYAHQKINYYAVFLLPPQMIRFYKCNINYLSEHAVDPDKRRYVSADEAPRHFIDIDHYGVYPFDSLPHKWSEAADKYSEDTLKSKGIVPWWIMTMHYRLVSAFKEKNRSRIMKLSAEIGHYIADAHVPLHTNSNHNGQKTGQEGIHGFWESRIPELLAEKEWNFFIGRAQYLSNPSSFIWNAVLESSAAADSVLSIEKKLSGQFVHSKYAFENRKGKIIKQYSTAFTRAYNKALNGMVERRMRQSVFAVASFWYTAWVDAGQPDLTSLSNQKVSEEDKKEYEELDKAWRGKGKMCQYEN